MPSFKKSRYIDEQKFRATIKRGRQKRIQAARDFINNYKKDKGCEICGESDIACLVFHHKDRKEKRFELSSMSKQGYSLKTITIEIEKCQLLCCNCHAKLHYYERRNDEHNDN